MSENPIRVPGGKTARLLTKGKYCPEDISVFAEPIYIVVADPEISEPNDSLLGPAYPPLTNPATESEVFAGKEFRDNEGGNKTGTFTITPEITAQDDLLARLAKAVRYKAAGNLDLDPEMAAQDALIADILTTLARKLPSKT